MEAPKNYFYDLPDDIINNIEEMTGRPAIKRKEHEKKIFYKNYTKKQIIEMWPDYWECPPSMKEKKQAFVDDWFLSKRAQLFHENGDLAVPDWIERCKKITNWERKVINGDFD